MIVLVFIAAAFALVGLIVLVPAFVAWLCAGAVTKASGMRGRPRQNVMLAGGVVGLVAGFGILALLAEDASDIVPLFIGACIGLGALGWLIEQAVEWPSAKRAEGWLARLVEDGPVSDDVSPPDAGT